MVAQNMHITHLEDEGSHPRRVTLDSIPTQGESAQLQTHCSKKDQLNVPSSGAPFIP